MAWRWRGHSDMSTSQRPVYWQTSVGAARESAGMFLTHEEAAIRSCDPVGRLCVRAGLDRLAGPFTFWRRACC